MDLHVYRNASDRDQDLKAAALSHGAVLGINAITLDELVRKLSPEVQEATPGQRLVLAAAAVQDAIPVRYALDALSELKAVRATPAQLRAAGLRDLAEYFETYDRLLKQAGLADPQDRRWLAASRVSDNPWLGRFESATLHALYDVNPPEFLLLRNLLERLPSGGSVMLFNATSNVKPTRFAEWTWQRFVHEEALAEKTFPEFFRPAGPARNLLERLFVFDESASQVAPELLHTSEWLRVLNCPARFGEIEAIGGAVMDRLRAGADPSDIAIVVRHIDAYGEMIEDVFSRYGIDCAFETGVPLLRVPYIKYLLALLDLVASERPRDALARVMASAYYEPRLSPSVDVERLLVEIGYIDRRHLKASALAMRHGSVLTSQIERLELLLDGLEGTTLSPSKFLKRLQPSPGLLSGRDSEAWEALSEEVEAVDSLTGSVPFERFRRLAMEIAGLRTVGRFFGKVSAPGVARIRILSPRSLGYRSYRWLFAPGFADGEIPAPSATNPLLADDVVEAVNRQTHPLRLQKSFHRNRKEPLYLFLLLDSATERVTLTYPGNTLEGETIHPSIYVGEILRHCDPADVALTRADEWRPRERGEFMREVAAAWRGNLLDAGQAESLLGKDVVLRARWEGLGSSRSALGAGVLPTNVRFSPSELDRLDACPFVFLARHRLKLQIADAPDFEVSPREVGTLAHRILKEFYLEPRGDSEEEAREKMRSIIDRQLAQVDIDGQGPNTVIDPSLWKIRRPQLARALMEYVRFAVQDARDGYETLKEYLDESLPPAKLGEVLLGGRPDHISVRRTGGTLTGIRIDDFKYSVASSAVTRSLSESFQIPVYAHLAARALAPLPEVSPEMTFSSSEIPMEGRYLLLRSPSTPVSARSVDGVLLDEVKERIARLVEKVRRGRLDPDPSDRETCRTCEYRRLCRFYGS